MEHNYMYFYKGFIPAPYPLMTLQTQRSPGPIPKQIIYLKDS